MAIQPPRPHLSKIEKQAIRLLANALVEDARPTPQGRNLTENEVALSDDSADQILIILEELLSDRKFQENLSFIDSVGFQKTENSALKKLYFSRHNRSSVMSTAKWLDLRRRIETMPLDHFQKMESILFRESEIGPRVRLIMIRAISLVEQRLERALLTPDKSQSSQTAVRNTKKALSTGRKGRGGICIDRRALTGLLIIISNGGVLFTTRDWTAAGVVSGMAGSLVATLSSQNLLK